MNQFIKGNYDLPHEKGNSKKKKSKTDSKPHAVAEFERQALARLGGSIAFVVKKSLVWNGENGEEAGKATS